MSRAGDPEGKGRDPSAELLGAAARKLLTEAGFDLADPEIRMAVAAGLDPAGVDRRVSAAERTKRALELRLAGYPYEEIATAVGWKSAGTAHKAVMRALAARAAEDVDEVRALEVARLDRMLAGGVFRRARQGDDKAVETALRIMAARCRLLPGLEVPAKAEHSGAIEGVGVGLVVELSIPAPDRSIAPVAEVDLHHAIPVHATEVVVAGAPAPG